MFYRIYLDDLNTNSLFQLLRIEQEQIRRKNLFDIDSS